jgi:hypothetical protein
MQTAEKIDASEIPPRPLWAIIAVALLFAVSFGLAYIAHAAYSEEDAGVRGTFSIIAIMFALILDYSVAGEVGWLWRTAVGIVLAIPICWLTILGRQDSTVETIEFGTFLSAELHPASLGSDASTLYTTGGTMQVYGRISAAIGDKVTVTKTRFPRAVDNDKDEACIKGLLGNVCYRILTPAGQHG